MRRRSRLVVAGMLAAAMTAGCAGESAEPRHQGGGQRFEFALIGDARYRPEEDAKFRRVMEAIDRSPVAFTIHVGDIKGGGSCADEVYSSTRRLLDELAAPLIYTPGDNEWTDCGDYRPLNRLALLRRVFFSTDESLGRRRLRLERQSRSYPENARWSHGRVTFATLHVVGSNNNLPTPPGGGELGSSRGDAAEHAARNAAALEWLAQTFARARAEASLGVVLAMHANPGFELPPGQRGGFEELVAALERETVAFAKPVVVVHGDTHVARIDKPLTSSATGRTVENLTRVETFGSPDVHWVRGVVDPASPGLFSFRKELVEANRAGAS